MKTIIFSDIDGTLIDEHYSFKKTKPIVKQLLSLEIPIILCSSKTRSEIEYYRKEYGIFDPFISENGAALFIPKGYFEKSTPNRKQPVVYEATIIGKPYSEIREKIQRIKTLAKLEIIGFADMTAEEIAKDSQLPPELVWMAKQREYDEPFKLLSGDEQILVDEAKKEGLKAVKGDRYWHLSGNHNKGTAVALMIKCFIERYGLVKTIGVGNGQNDVPMLELMDKPILTEKDEKIEMLWQKVLTSAINFDFDNGNC